MSAHSIYSISIPPSTTPVTNPTPPTYNLLVKSLFYEQNHIKLVENFKKCSDKLRFRYRHNIYENVVSRLASAKKFSLIEEILEHQKNYKNITSEGFATRLIYLYGKAGMFDHALQLFDELPQLNCQRTLKSFNALLNACVLSKQFDRTEMLFRELPLSLSIIPDVISYNIVIKALSEMGSYDSAESMLGEMESNGVTPDLITFNTTMYGFYYNGRFSDGERIWDRMEENGIAPDIFSYNAKLQGLLYWRNISEAGDLVEELQTGEPKPNLKTYNILIRAYCNNGYLDEAKSMYGCLLKNSFHPSGSTFEALIPSIYEKGDIDLALKLCEENVGVNSDISVGILQLVVDGLVKASRVEEAEKLVKLATSKMYAHSKLEMPS